MVKKRWEYLEVVLGATDAQEKLNNHGLDGWELITVTPESDQLYAVAYFKRELAEDPEDG